jgi:hypothetical protein
MIIGISTPNYNPNGALLLRCEESSSIGGVTRRVSRAATLDGGSVLTDFGVTASDTTIQLRVPITRPLDDTIRLLVTQNPILIMATNLGCYSGAVDSYRTDDGIGLISFLIKATLS